MKRATITIDLDPLSSETLQRVADAATDHESRAKLVVELGERYHEKQARLRAETEVSRSGVPVRDDSARIAELMGAAE